MAQRPLENRHIAGRKSFTEYTKDGFPTVFTITQKEAPRRYEFDLQNRNLRGHWVGTLRESGQGTLLTMTEEVAVANPVMNLLPALT